MHVTIPSRLADKIPNEIQFHFPFSPAQCKGDSTYVSHTGMKFWFAAVGMRPALPRPTDSVCNMLQHTLLSLVACVMHEETSR